MGFFVLDKWPLWVVSVGMILCAIIDGWKFKVPNKITFPLIITGWLLGVFYTCTALPEIAVVPWAARVDPSNRIAATFIATIVGFFLLLPLYVIGGMGEGDMKMSMAFSAWVGAYYGLNQGLWVILYAWIAGVLVGGVIGVFQIIFLRQFREVVQHSKEIGYDLLTSKGNIEGVAEKAAERRKRQIRLPYGVPLCIGFVGTLLYLNWS